MKKLILTSVVCLLAGIIPAQADNLVDSEGVLLLPEGFSLKVIPEGRAKKTVQPENGKVVLPYGKYWVEYWDYHKKDALGKQWKIRGYPKDILEFHITDQPVSLDITPEPINAVVTVRCWDAYQFKINLEGPDVQRLSLYCDNARSPAPKLEITNQDKSFNVTLNSAYG